MNKAWVLVQTGLLTADKFNMQQILPLFSRTFDCLPLAFCFNPVPLTKLLLDKVRLGDIGIAYGDGCIALFDAADAGALFNTLVLINPTLGRGVRFPDHVSKVVVFYSRHWLRAKLINLVLWPLRLLKPDLVVGSLGSVGYYGKPDTRVFCFDASQVGSLTRKLDATAWMLRKLLRVRLFDGR